MRKYAFIALIMLIASVFGGCGSSDGTSSTVIASSNDSVKPADITSYISGKTLYSVSSTTSTTSYAFGAGATTGTLTKNGALNGTWSYTATTGEITITPVSGAMILKRIQVEAQGATSEYWLMYDANASNKIYRFYFNQTEADAYLTSITTAAGFKLMGGTIQGNAIVNLETKAVSTFVGSDQNTPLGSADGLGLLARFNRPSGITTDGKGNLYVTDTDNHTIRKIESNGNVTRIAGIAGSPGSANSTTGTLATFSSPQGITSDGSFLYITDTGNAIIRKYNLSTTEVTTLAGIAGSLGAVDGIGSGAQFYTPVGITTDGTNLYVTDVSYNTIRKIQIATLANSSYSKSVTTLAGTPGSAGFTDAPDFSGSSARFSQPVRITTDGSDLYVTDFKNHTIRKVVIATGKTSTLNGYTLGANYSPSGITTDGANLYVTEVNTTKDNATYLNIIRKIVISTDVVSTIAGGSSSTLNSLDSSSALLARFSGSPDIVSMGTSLFVTNYSDNKTIPTNPSINNIRQIGP